MIVLSIDIRAAAPFLSTPSGWKYVFGQASLPLP